MLQDRTFMKRTISSPWDVSSRTKVEQRAPKVDLQSVTHFATWNIITLNGLVTRWQHHHSRYHQGVAARPWAVNGQRRYHTALVQHGSHKGSGISPARLLYAWFLRLRGQLSLIVAYTPTEDADAMAKDSFYHQLASTIQSLPKHSKLLILGDMNANPGPRMPASKMMLTIWCGSYKWQFRPSSFSMFLWGHNGHWVVVSKTKYPQVYMDIQW